MSDYLHQKGYIYPLGKLSDEENNSFYKKIKEEENFELDKDKFELEYMGKNDYLLWLTYSTYGEESSEFGSCRPCNQQEIYYHAPKFRAILGEIDTAKLKYIDFCYYNSTECTVDYYLGEEEYKPMTLTEAIQHCKDVADSKCDECGKEYAKLAEWLQELAAFNDETPITEEWLNEKFWFDTECEYWDFDTDVNPVEIREIRKNHLYSIFVPHFNYKINTTFSEYLKPYRDMVKKLEAYEDKTYITSEWLTKNGFELQKVQNGIDKEPQTEYIYCNDAIEISAELRDEERGIWRVWINFLDECCPTDLDICTVGQLRMFLAICGLDNIVEQLK